MKKSKLTSLLLICLAVFLFYPTGAIGQEQSQEQSQEQRIEVYEKEINGFILGFKLNGNLGYLFGKNDLNEGLKGWDTLVEEVAPLWGEQKVGEIKPLGLGSHFGGELTLSFIPRLAIGLGVGYLQFIRQSTVTLLSEWGDFEVTRKPNVTAIPLTLSLYYSFPLGEVLKAVAGVGVGYYLGKFKYNIDESFDGDSVWMYFEANSNAFGFHGSLDFEVNISRTMALVFGFSGRVAKLKNLSGTFSIDYEEDPEYNFTDERTIYYVEEDGSDYHESVAGKWYPNLLIFTEKPEASFYRNVREAEISLNSLALQIGILIRLSQLFK